MSDSTQVALFWLMVIAATPVVQYAWTFFYLRLVEIDEPFLEVGPLYAKAEESRPALSESPATAGQGDGGNGART